VHHIFEIEQLKEFIRVKCLGTKSFDEEFIFLDEFYSDSISWDRKLISLNYLLSRILEQLEKENVNNQVVIDYIYSLKEQCQFSIQEGNIRFIESLLSNDCDTSLTIEEELVIAQNKIEK